MSNDEIDLDADLAYCEHHVEGPCPVCMPDLFEDDHPYAHFKQRCITGIAQLLNTKDQP